MVFLNRSAIPVFLKNSSFYVALTEDSDDFEIPDNCYAETDELNSPQDFVCLLQVLRFWDVHTVPKSLIEYCVENPMSDWQEYVAEFEADLQYLAFLRKINEAPVGERFLIAVTSGKLELVQYINEKRGMDKLDVVQYKDDANPYFAAARSGNLDMLKYLYEHSHPAVGAEITPPPEVFFYTLDWETNTYNVCQIAAEYGHLSCLKFLYESGVKLTGQEYTKAVLNGHLDCIQFVHACQCCWLPGVAQKAIELGYFDCLQFAIENGCPIDGRLMRTAASSRRLDYLIYLHTHGGTLTTDCMNGAATAGHLPTVQYLHSHNVPWSTYIPQITAQKGYIDCLQYAIEHGCPAEETIANRAVGGNQLPCVMYLLSKGYRASENAVSYAQGNGWTAVCDYLTMHNK